MDTQSWLRKGAPYWPLAVALAIVLSGTLYGTAPALLVLTASLLVMALVLGWLSLGELTNEEPLTLNEALELAAPEQREQEKASVLRGLKDLEQEHRFGKITDAEFAAESARMRLHAKHLLSSFDRANQERQARVESRIQRFLKAKMQPAKAPKKAAPSKSGGVT
jgi:hypothetical protein